MLNKILILAVFLVSVFVGNAQSSKQEIYIDRYKEIAISEMERAGVPASIKLAQGILESGSGKSTLARKANNHFGMKCGPAWKGKEYYKEDDDYDQNGKLIKSCFRVFDSAKECYIAHSNFLTDSRKRYRYGFLFDLDPKDYKAWSRGLKKAGYATSPTYAEKLIKVIETYNLDRFDDMSSDNSSGTNVIVQRDFFKVNNVKVVLAKGDETAIDIGIAQDVATKYIVKYNEKITRSNQSIEKGSRVFLQKKRSGYRGKQKYHVVKTGETLFDISQKYAVSLKRLRNRNRIGKGERPAKGAKIKLRGFKVFKKNKPRIASGTPEDDLKDDFEDNNKKDDEVEFEDEIIFDGDDSEDFDNFEDDIEEDEETEQPVKNRKIYHVVTRGETLYGIARRYGTTVDEILVLNKMQSSTISIGQRIRVK